MIPTDELKVRLRKLLNEKIPTSGTEADTRFEDIDIVDLLTESNTVYEAAAVGWTMKAGMYQAEMGEIESTSTGQESYKLIALKDRQSYALKQAEIYMGMGKQQDNSFIFKVVSPEVL